MNIEAYIRVLDLYARYARAIDDGRFQDWLDLFADDCSYFVVPLENTRQALQLPIIRCRTRAMLNDRIVSLQQANIYNIHTDRHLITNVQLIRETTDRIEVEADFAIHQTDQEGESRLFGVGRYRTELVGPLHALRIRAQHVTLDTASVPTLMATPL
jgi:anthranilate 1,2-dioxygenase small subunit